MKIKETYIVVKRKKKLSNNCQLNQDTELHTDQAVELIRLFPLIYDIQYDDICNKRYSN